MRGKKPRKRIQPKDAKYGSTILNKFINCLMWDGKKNTARTVVYDALEEIRAELKTDNPLEIFEMAMRNVSPNMEVRSRRIGGASYQVPREVRPERKTALAMRWILDSSRKQKGARMATKLARELVAASRNEGEAVRKRENTHKMAEANRAFAHFAW
ncbi:MAG: 30S ribosomal protein S7 [Candidatus Vogelbacteria bacterium]|nr:30S ribosomal protein S7 [Candidatus Vogelbacteria bacterium]